ncbi:hypothetical protein ACFYPZ_40120 [Streptomyces sp. NPDC005506]|uniref:hypothetical protein n=1 Tax=unclassified Streptomyces TaxID=2593676 RepID=UPI0036A0012B
MTVGALREALDLHGVADDLPVVIHAHILDGECVSVLRLESVHFTSTVPEGTVREEHDSRPYGYGHVTRVVLSAGMSEGSYARKDELRP